MSFRERLLFWCGPSLFAGITLDDWLALLRENRFGVDLPYWWRAAVITLGSFGNSLVSRHEDAAYGREVAVAEVAPPIFVLGIWRSGTTHLHNLLAVDRRLAAPNLYQASYPHTFLSTEGMASWLGRLFIPDRRPQDNMRFGFGLPAEDELALCATTPFSPMLSLVFPRRAKHYDRYLTLRGIPDAEVAAWKDALLRFVKKLTWKHRKPLVLKSPAHTARIRLLLDIFPEAKFVHIHRSPYTVIQSTRHTTRKLVEYFVLQRPTLDLDERTIRQYREVYDAFFEEKGMIRADRFHEVRFDDLVADPIGQMQRLYKTLGLPDFGEVEADMRRYVATLASYRRNTYDELDVAMKERIANECRRCFLTWGYST